MDRGNPYQAPEASNERSASLISQRPIRAAIKFGATIGAMAGGGFGVLFMLVVQLIVAFRSLAAGAPPVTILTGRFLGRRMASVLFLATYSACCGAIVTGVIATARRLRERRSPNL
jgi:hypothetical protein